MFTAGQNKIQQGLLREGYELINEALNLLNNVYGAMHPGNVHHAVTFKNSFKKIILIQNSDMGEDFKLVSETHLLSIKVRKYQQVAEDCSLKFGILEIPVLN